MRYKGTNDVYNPTYVHSVPVVTPGSDDHSPTVRMDTREASRNPEISHMRYANLSLVGISDVEVGKSKAME